jgi:hypothetical protein
MDLTSCPYTQVGSAQENLLHLIRWHIVAPEARRTNHFHECGRSGGEWLQLTNGVNSSNARYQSTGTFSVDYAGALGLTDFAQRQDDGRLDARALS